MKRTLALLVLALCACEKKAEPKPAPKPAPIDPGATVAAPVPAPAQPCDVLRVSMSKDKLTHTRGDTAEVPLVGGAVDPTALTAAFGARAQKCVGDLLLTAGDEVAYQDIITVMDYAVKAGFQNIGLDDAAAPRPSAPRPGPPAQHDMAKAPVVIIGPDHLSVAGTDLAPGGDLEAQIVAALEQAKAGGTPAGDLIIQADRATGAKQINAVIRAAHKTGFDNVLFAIQKTP